MTADFVANDFDAIARAMRPNAASPLVVLHFWDMLSRLTMTSMHASVEAAVAEAYVLETRYTAVLDCVTTINGTVLLDDEALAGAVERYREGMPI